VFVLHVGGVGEGGGFSVLGEEAVIVVDVDLDDSGAEEFDGGSDAEV
jgi:hypothetical protein